MSKTIARTEHNIKPVIYSDFFTDFSASTDTGQLNRKTNENAVKQSVRNLLLTDFYERPFQPEIGSNLRSLLFEPFTAATEIRAKTYVEEVFDNHEPRADLLKVNITADPDRGAIFVEIYFRIINSVQPVSLNITLERTR
jgi:phage baseplate assembly protein W